MKIIKYDNNNSSKLFKRSKTDVNNVLNIVQDIITNVKENKDEAIKNYTKTFDKVEINELKVSKEEIAESYGLLDEKVLNALKKAIKNIEKFHRLEIPKEWKAEINTGIEAGQIIRPINSVGCYIPGGRAIYPSTILMTVIPAKIAGVKRIVATSPPQINGKISPAILVAADLAGVDEIYKVGGAQAIAALSYGTQSIKNVEKIVGPGNIFVTAAKKLVYGDVDIDFHAGPSEVLIIADESANPSYIAYDILSQAEHDPNASCFLVTNNEEIAIKTNEEIDRLSKIAVRKDIILESLDKYGKIILTNDIDEAIEVSNKYAPEHLIIATNDDDNVLTKITNAGSIFLGNYSPVAAGDYGSGTNHVLPTSGGASVYSGLSTESFLKKPTVQRITKEGLTKLSNVVVPLAEYEGLIAHSDSVKVRIDKLGN
ncbi:MAG: histidinol dehydrogenase [Methanobrevibacter sp.]|jgi:histidinol dehydrogenase|nr:histidinol dehydrogenase [Candidatus Methanoflexus mossambicus]